MRDPEDERLEQERERRLRKLLGLLQIGGLGLLAVMIAGLLPRLLAGWFPGLARPWVTVAVGVAAAFVALSISVLRLRRLWRDAERRAPGDRGAPRR